MAGEKMVVEWSKAKSDRRDRNGYGRNGFGNGGRDFGGRGGMASRAVDCYDCGKLEFLFLLYL